MRHVALGVLSRFCCRFTRRALRALLRNRLAALAFRDAGSRRRARLRRALDPLKEKLDSSVHLTDLQDGMRRLAPNAVTWKGAANKLRAAKPKRRSQP